MNAVPRFASHSIRIPSSHRVDGDGQLECISAPDRSLQIVASPRASIAGAERQE